MSRNSKSPDKDKGKKKSPRSSGHGGVLRRFARRVVFAAAILVVILCAVGDWFVHHPKDWLDAKTDTWPHFATDALSYAGDRTGDLTDALGWTGHDAVYDYDEEAPTGAVFFAGAPRRVGPPAPADIVVLQRGEFAVGWSPSFRHPVWAAYHVPPEALHPSDVRPTFQRDRGVASSPAANAYDRTGYDRGHMVPNHAIASRFGEVAQKKTFLMTNIAPQAPSLNRGPWRNVEVRIADLWTARYGEIWVIVGAVSENGVNRETLQGSNIDVPIGFYQIVVAQTPEGVRALAVYMPQDIAPDAFPTRQIVSIDELERMTGLDFLPDLPEFIQNPLEAEVPTRLWPVRPFDVFRLILERFKSF